MYSNQPEVIDNQHIDILENFVLHVYNPKRSILKTLAEERVDQFLSLSNSNLRLLPFSRSGLIEHTKRSCIQAWWLWRQGIFNVKEQNPEKWGWLLNDGKYVPRWQTVHKVLEVSDVVVLAHALQ